MSLRVIFCFIIILMLQSPCLAQEGGGKSSAPKKDQSLKSKRKLRREDRKKWREQRREKRLEEKRIRDHHKRIQTKEVRQRMKRSRKKSTGIRENKKETFFQRLFHKTKKGRAARKPRENTHKIRQH